MLHENFYKKQGLESQRKYPNEPMLRFLSTLPKGGKVLEIGCGSGANLWAIAREGFEAYGQDIAPTGLKFCKQMLASYGQKARLSVGDFHDLRAYPDSFFDAVVDVVSMQHTSRKSRVVSEVCRVLKPGGAFFSYHFESTSLFAGHEITVLDSKKADALLKDFDVSIDHYKRQQSDGNYSNYMAITAKKAVECVCPDCGQGVMTCEHFELALNTAMKE